MTQNKKSLIIALAVVVVGVILFFFVFSNRQAQAPYAAPTGTEQAGGNAPAPQAPNYQGPPTYPAIPILSPKAGDVWAIGTLHTISWSAVPEFTGSIYLVDMKTGLTVGWILSNTDPKQTSYGWDTQSVYLARNSGLKKDLAVGTYEIKIQFDNARYPVSESSIFTVVYPEQIKVATYTVTAQNYAFSPKNLTVKQGSKVAFVNKDSVAHNIAIGNLSPLPLPVGGSVTLDTSVLTPATYNYYCTIHPSMTGTLIVQ